MINQLTSGIDFGLTFPKYRAGLLATMPALYELLPRGRHRVLTTPGGELVDPLDLDVWIENEWGLLNPDEDQAVLTHLLPEVGAYEERRAIALDHLSKCLNSARRFQQAIDQPASIPHGFRLIVFAGDAQKTKVAATAHRRIVEFIESAPGDGIVARYSALMDETFASRPKASRLRSPIDWSQVHFLLDRHLDVTKNQNFSDTLLFMLLQE